VKDEENRMRADEAFLEISMGEQGKGKADVLPFLEDVVSGDVEAFEKIVELYQKRLFSIAYKIVGTVEDTKDIIQETFMKIYKNCHNLKNVKKPFPYFCRMTINGCMDWLKKQNKNHVMFNQSVEYLQSTVRTSSANPESFTQKKEVGQIVMNSLSCLTERERAALCLRDLEEFSTREAALILGCTEATVRSHVASARVKIKNYLVKKYPELKR
jgi:RNA polymerase sigma-70 factor (ECF subfamily)